MRWGVVMSDGSRSTIASVAVILCFVLSPGCYPEVHVVDLRASGPSWQPVYASPAELLRVEDNTGAPAFRRGRLFETDEGLLTVRADLLALVDSLRGFYLAVPNGGQIGAPVVAYVGAAGTRAIRVVNDTVLRLDRLSGTALVDVSDPAAPTLVDGPEAVTGDFPDPTVPPAAGARDPDSFGADDVRHFLCPDAHQPAPNERFLGWRVGYSADLLELCYRP